MAQGTTLAAIAVKVRDEFQFPREVAQGTTSQPGRGHGSGSFNSPEKWLRGLLPHPSENGSVYSFNSPEKWLRGLPYRRLGGVRRVFQFPREVAQGTTSSWRSNSPGRKFQFPREVAQGTTWRRAHRNTPKGFNSPEKWLRGLLTYFKRFKTSFEVSIPPRSGSGDYSASESIVKSVEFQFPREVAQGTTK